MKANQVSYMYISPKGKFKRYTYSFFKEYSVTNDIVALGNHTSMMIYDEGAHDTDKLCANSLYESKNR